MTPSVPGPPRQLRRALLCILFLSSKTSTHDSIVSCALSPFVGVVGVVGGAVHHSPPPFRDHHSRNNNVDRRCIRTAPYHPSIHTLGNTGFGGFVHACAAWPFTAAIDHVAYSQLNMRRAIARRVIARSTKYQCRDAHAHVERRNLRVLDVGCGAGTLTYELAFTNELDVVGVDTSREMIRVAQMIVRHPNVRFEVCNGIDVCRAYDIGIVCMVMHELPPDANAHLLRHLRHVCSEVWIADIVPTYVPSKSMLAGEPYLLEYLLTIEDIVRQERVLSREDVVPGHVRLWKVGSYDHKRKKGLGATS